MRIRAALIVPAAAAMLLIGACAPKAADSSTQSLKPTGSPRPPASMCDATSLASSDLAPRSLRRGAQEWEALGRTYVTVMVPVRVVVPCTGGDWKISMGPAGGDLVALRHAGEAGLFGPYAAGDRLTFQLSWPETASSTASVPARVQINGIEVQVDAPGWDPAETTWAGPAVGEPTATFPPAP